MNSAACRCAAPPLLLRATPAGGRALDAGAAEGDAAGAAAAARSSARARLGGAAMMAAQFSRAQCAHKSETKMAAAAAAGADVQGVKRPRVDDTAGHGKGANGEAAVVVADNYIGGKFVAPAKGNYLDVRTPLTGGVIGRVALSDGDDVKVAVEAAKRAAAEWGAQTVKNRVRVLFKFHELLEHHANELAEIIMREHGKNRTEALGEVSKGNETVEYAMSMPQLIGGAQLEVSSGVTCSETRRPLGVVASIVPFNFPCMVPLWTLPIAIATGNAVILKPSEKVPLTSRRIAELWAEAGLPAGVFTIVNGTAPVVEAICDHPDIKAVTFVGSTKVAELVARRCRAVNKRVLALGGAKNHLVTLPDCNRDMAAQDIVNSFTGCTGQRCMAASVLLTVGDQKELVAEIVARAAKLQRGQADRQLGPVIDRAAQERIARYIAEAQQGGAELLLDGRGWAAEHPEGYWMGPSVLLHKRPSDAAMREEIFGPVLSIYQAANKEEALEIQRSNPYGNAACVYTTVGEHAEWFTKRFSAGMLGVNVGVPVPREPFSFGGTNASKFGDMDITGDGGMEFFTQRIKVTTKWYPPSNRTWMD
jgi:methylmalonic acid semialdehyde dehydrogenase